MSDKAMSAEELLDALRCERPPTIHDAFDPVGHWPYDLDVVDALALIRTRDAALIERRCDDLRNELPLSLTNASRLDVWNAALEAVRSKMAEQIAATRAAVTND